MPSDTPTGVPHPDRPSRWLIPPWQPDADFHEVVRHFIAFQPWHTTNPTHLHAYYVAFQAALSDAPTQEHPTPDVTHWYAEMRDNVAHCAQLTNPGRTELP